MKPHPLTELEIAQALAVNNGLFTKDELMVMTITSICGNFKIADIPVNKDHRDQIRNVIFDAKMKGQKFAYANHSITLIKKRYQLTPEEIQQPHLTIRKQLNAKRALLVPLADLAAQFA